MCPAINRRCFVKSATAGLCTLPWLLSQAVHRACAAAQTSPPTGTPTRIGRVYLGNPNPGWPMARVDLAAEQRRFEAEFARLQPALAEVEFVDAGLVRDAAQMSAAQEKFKGVDGILALHLTMGIGGQLKSLLEVGPPVTLFALPYSGHEWHIIAGLQREGQKIDVFPTSRFDDVVEAIRPFRALHRLREARVLHVSQHAPDAAYVAALKSRFGTEIVGIGFDELKAAYDQADRAAAQADADRWIREAMKVVEPTAEEVFKSSIMYIALRDLLSRHRAMVVTMNCLGMGLIDHGMGYPCLGFVRLNNQGLGGVCEADLKSTMTHLIFSGLVGRPGFVTDPVFDFAQNAIIHAHCVAATQMEGPAGPAAPYVIRNHLEDARGASLQVRLPIDRKLTMARLIGTDLMLFSTGDAVDSPFDDRGCRTKLTMRVNHIDRFLEHWSSGLHRVVFYGDHTRDLRRFCRFAGIRVLEEGVDDLHGVPGLEWETHVHA